MDGDEAQQRKISCRDKLSEGNHEKLQRWWKVQQKVAVLLSVSIYTTICFCKQRPLYLPCRTDMLLHLVNQTDQVMPVPLVLQRLDQSYSILTNNSHTAFIKHIFVSTSWTQQHRLFEACIYSIIICF